MDLDGVAFIESQGDYLQWMALPKTDKKPQCLLVAHGQLDRLSDRLSPCGFVRIHRRYLVNLQHLQAFDGEVVTLDHLTLPVARSRRTRLQNRMDHLPIGQNDQSMYPSLPHQGVRSG